MRSFITILFFFIGLAAKSQKPTNLIAKGNEAYKKQDFKTAAADYNKALEKDPRNEVALFNMANAYQQQNSYADAAKMYGPIISESKDVSLQSKAYNNSGLAMARQKQLEQAIEQFKGSLRLNPGDNEVRENLQKAINDLKKQQQKQDQDKKDQKKQDQKDQQQQQQQQKNNLNQNKAEQLLKQLQDKERQLQKDVQKQKSNPQQQEKDW